MKNLFSLANKYEKILNKAGSNNRELLKNCAIHMANMYQTWLNLLTVRNYTPTDGTFKYTNALAAAQSMASENILFKTEEKDLIAIKQKFATALNTVGSDIMFDAQNAGWFNKGTGVWSDAAAKDAAFKAADYRRAALASLEQVK